MRNQAENNRKHQEFVGRFGDNKSILLEDGQLKLGGAAGMMLVLQPQEKDLFKIKFTPGQMLRINRNRKGKIESISISTPQQKSWKTHLKITNTKA